MGRPYPEVSFWLETCGDDLTPRPSLTADAEFDTVIVGGGFTGLWTAHALQVRDPGRRIAILEREIVGFGASGRNGGWASAFFPLDEGTLEHRYDVGTVRRVARLLAGGVDELGATLDKLGIDAHYAKGGALSLATGAGQLPGIKSAFANAQRLGLGDRYELLSAEEARARVDSPLVVGALYDKACAVVHPARLVRGLARSLEERGVTIFERTAVEEVMERDGANPPAVRAAGHRVRAREVVLATEGYTAQLRPWHRSVLPIYSLITLTEPIPAERWAEAGWAEREAVSDGRHVLIYLQRTADDRILFGGRGAPYHYGSSIRERHDRHQPTFAHLQEEFRRMFPQLAGTRFTHSWGGPLGITRDWMPSICVAPERGVAWSRGYAGDGVTFAFVAGHTLADLITGDATDRAAMPWVGHEGRQWEVEPLRWLGSRLVYWSFRRQDVRIEKTGRAAARRSLGALLSGREK